MESFFVRYRNLVVLLALLVAQILGLAMQVRRAGTGQASDGRSVSLIRFWANSVVSPPERALHSSGSGIAWLWNNYVDLRHVRQQNADLQKTVDRLRLEQAALLEDAKQGQRLQALLNFQQKYIYKTVAAQAIGTSGTEQSRVFYIDKGKDAGIDRDMAVITPDGIVGKIRDVFPHTAQVLAINDQSSGAGVILESTRIRGILRGNAAGQPQIEDVVRDQRIQAGEKVLTAGGDQIFPRGLAVGTVEKVLERSGTGRIRGRDCEVCGSSGPARRSAGGYIDRAAVPAGSAAGHGGQRGTERRRGAAAEDLGRDGGEAAGIDRSEPAAGSAAAERCVESESGIASASGDSS